MAPNVSRPTERQRTLMRWLINDSAGGFQEHTMSSNSGPPQYVSIDDNDIKRSQDLKDIEKKDKDILKLATIDRQVSHHCY